jgi:saccharopine dehydrogenase (NAD+, L-lysine-forming)
MRIVALGASGNAGREIAVLLARGMTVGDELVLAGRDTVRLARTRAEVEGPATLNVATVDVANQARVREVVAGADLVVVTVSRPDLVADLAEAVLDAGADWVDTMLSTPSKLAALRELEPEITRRGRCFVTDAGFHPGLPAVLVRWAAGQLEEIHEAEVFGGMRLDWRAESLAESTIAEMLDEFASFDMSTWKDGSRRRLRWSESPTVDFGAPIGRKVCVPMPLAEMEGLPLAHPELRSCGFYVSGFGPVMDYAALPVLMTLSRIHRLRPATIRLARWSMRRLASYPPPHRLVVQLAAVGTNAGGPATAAVRVSGGDGYLLTAAPAVACIRRILDGTSRHPGLHLQAHLVNPGPFLEDLSSLGLQVETSTPLRTEETEAGRN